MRIQIITEEKEQSQKLEKLLIKSFDKTFEVCSCAGMDNIKSDPGDILIIDIEIAEHYISDPGFLTGTRVIPVCFSDPGLRSVMRSIRHYSNQILFFPEDKQQIIGIIEHECGISDPMEKSIIGKSTEVKDMRRFIRLASESSLPVLLEGESGTGKELMAKALHDFSPRAKENFVAFNCAAVPRELMENELFGHEKGSFTGADSVKPGLFELADKGTLFLDEIGDMNMDAQSKLLRVLETGMIRRIGGTKEKRVDVRIVTATNKILENEIKEQRFRLDLYYRLCVLRYYTPSLNKRKDDIEILVKHFLMKNGADRKIDEEYINKLKEYSWKGNIRELKNVVERSIVFSDTRLSVDTLPDYFGDEARVSDAESPEKESLKDFSRQVELEFIKRAIDKCGGNKVKASKMLGISRYQLYRKIKEE